ncbi:inositol 2-dehydrogenase [Companilactobacillus hulinensis]|uniref:inositol 2-dehydrogenase n=1 Tax=Companilactobacillus hulinensis TaxID=2486007 RepID=UPI001CDD1D70|nr:inositol 2-dehydrogenase [Companilactobacillus hulinensis]
MVKIKIGVIGVGRIGKMHIKNIANLRDQFEITAISDPNNPELAQIAEDYHIQKFSKDYHDVLSGDVDAVVIASSTNTHAKIITAAAKAGKDIMCEKPIDTDIERIKKVLKVVDDNGVILQIGFNRRFDHNFRKIHDYVVDGTIGNPHIIKVSSRDPEPPSYDYVKVSGGLFSDMMIHDLDMVRYLSNSEVVEVYANGAVLVDPEIGKLGDIDTAIVSLKFANGALGVIDNSRQAVYGYDQRAEVFGSKGQAFSENDKNSNVELDLNDGGHLDKIPYFFIDRYVQTYVDEFKEFYKTIVNQTEPIVTGLDGLRAVQLAQACQKSLETHEPVKL